jgi:hypothetical protein
MPPTSQKRGNSNTPTALSVQRDGRARNKQGVSLWEKDLAVLVVEAVVVAKRVEAARALAVGRQQRAIRQEVGEGMRPPAAVHPEAAKEAAVVVAPLLAALLAARALPPNIRWRHSSSLPCTGRELFYLTPASSSGGADDRVSEMSVLATGGSLADAERFRSEKHTPLASTRAHPRTSRVSSATRSLTSQSRSPPHRRRSNPESSSSAAAALAAVPDERVERGAVLTPMVPD